MYLNFNAIIIIIKYSFLLVKDASCQVLHRIPSIRRTKNGHTRRVLSKEKKNRKKHAFLFRDDLQKVVPIQTSEYEPKYHIFAVVSLISSSEMACSWPAKSFSGVRKSMQWHSFLSLIGTQGQFQKPCCASAALSS